MIGRHLESRALADRPNGCSDPPLGVVLIALFTNGLAIVLGYAVLKSGSILLAGYLHAINNQVTAFIVVLGYKLFDPAFSFGVGMYGIATLAIIVIIVLRDPVWRGKGGNPSRPAGY